MVKKLSVTVIVEDTCPKRHFLGEHGLSLWVEVDGRAILFDAGFSGTALVNNLPSLGLRLSKIEACVLSHPHDDHSGGLRAISQDIGHVPFYCVTDCFISHVPDAEKVRNDLTDIHYVKHHQEIFPGVLIPAEQDTINSPYPTKEINLVIDLQGKGLVIIVGCAHHGLRNLVEQARALRPGTPVYALIGGFHLKDTPHQEIIDTISYLRQLEIKILAPNHCTGFNAVRLMAQEYPEAMHQVLAGPTGTLHTGMRLYL